MQISFPVISMASEIVALKLDSWNLQTTATYLHFPSHPFSLLPCPRICSPLVDSATLCRLRRVYKASKSREGSGEAGGQFLVLKAAKGHLCQGPAYSWPGNSSPLICIWQS